MMLPDFVIGLREGLETAVVLGAIAVFLVHQDRRHQLRTVWLASGAAAVICALVAVTLRLVEVSLSTIATDRVEAVVGIAAVLTVTYMVIWMRRFPKDLLADSTAKAARTLTSGSSSALAAMAFLVVLREGFEISVFVLAVTGNTTTSPWLGAAGAAAGIVVAAVIGAGVVRGGLRLDVARFFRITAVVLVVSAAGLTMTAVHAANAGGWLVFAQAPQFNWAALAPPGSIRSAFVTGLFGLQPYPDLLEVALWLGYLVPMLLVVLWPTAGRVTRPARSPRRQALLLLYGFSVVLIVAASVSVRGVLNNAAGAPSEPAQMALPPQGLTSGSYLLFRSTAPGGDYGRVGLVAAADPAGPQALTSMACDRVDFEGGVGLCLTRPTSGVLISTSAIVFNAQFKTLHTVALSGLPSRARVSPDGRFGSITTFVNGDSYAAPSAYSTRTDIIDMRTGKILFDLAALTVIRDGQLFYGADFNFWGVTFAADEQHFYATLGTGGHTYLLHGDLATRRATVIATNVECPSLSPDGTMIAFKRRLPGPGVKWRLSVLDLATMQAHPLAETRSVDDQVEWLNDSTVLYGVLQDKAIAAENPLSSATPTLASGAPLGTDTFSVPADGSGKPTLFSSDAWSEVVTNR